MAVTFIPLTSMALPDKPAQNNPSGTMATAVLPPPAISHDSFSTRSNMTPLPHLAKPEAVSPTSTNQILIKLIEDGYRKLTRETPIRHLWKYVRCSYAELGYDSCSEYGIQTLKNEPNTLKAVGMTAMRVATCTPWTKDWPWATENFGNAKQPVQQTI